MLDFIKVYWPVIAALFCDAIFFVIIVIVRKQKISSDAVRSMIADVLPGYIKLAEVSATSGKTKFYFVLDLVYKTISKFINKQDEAYWMAYIGECIEAILSTPQKKEDLSDEKKISK